MTPIELYYPIFGLILSALLVLLLITCMREKRFKAAGKAVLLLAEFNVVWVGWYLLVGTHSALLLIPPSIAVLGIVVFYWPTGKPVPLSIGVITQRVDERDVAFAREEYQPGTARYDEYYGAHPRLKDADDRMRRLPELLAPGGKYYDGAVAALVSSDFREIEAMTTTVDGQVAVEPEAVEPGEMTAWVKREMLAMGADEVGIAKLNPMYVYSHVGRGPEAWGQPIVNAHKYAIMFSLEMDYFDVEKAPRLPITRETARRYKQAARISIGLARRIREMGYPARAHIAGSNYQIMLPPVAHDAGLGELGRMGYLISPKSGARVRLGGLTTDLPLLNDEPITFGVQDFCDKCLKCSINCPSSAIPSGGKVNVRGVEKWQLNIEQCIQYWRVIGTDCGLCMKVCPYSHPPTFIHNLVRSGCRRSSLARRISIWADDFFYGRKLRLPIPPA
ncbi:MAG: 4Fe-4S dicluster domain-containing protein [candidate division Zixibacteria bacterium]|nr:4Fe-4S dicluster domain-containing protein [candidate division Zixibacteria bacterium]MDH3938855.1 4Fe-4S dicluster domain-containing protein [candidate division Zixibacteria bacterium]MDH4033180.1 4Fe-4S dicluster domain-containing protein [candidate division Zixibacteria bacterium]